MGLAGGIAFWQSTVTLKCIVFIGELIFYKHMYMKTHI